MSVKMEKTEKNKVKFEIDVDVNEFEDALKEAYTKNRKKYSVPGFRKGKAPQGMIERLYGEGVFYEDALDQVLPKLFDEAVKEHNITPVEYPEYDIKELKRKESIVFTAQVTVMPEVESIEYKGLEAEEIVYEVTDEDVESEIEKIRDRNARKITVEDRPVREGDTVTIDFKGLIDGEVFEGGQAENHELEIGSKSFIPGFEEGIIGKEQGQTFNVDVSFPKEYGNKEVAGKKVTFEITLHQISAKEHPELDDEFAKDVSDFDTLDEYKADLRKTLEEQAENKSKEEIQQNVLEAFVDKAVIDIPDVMIENGMRQNLSELEQQIKGMGSDKISVETYLGWMGMTIEQYRERMKPQVENEIKLAMGLGALIEKEDIKPEPTVVDEEITKIAESQNVKRDTFLKRMTSSQKQSIEDYVQRITAIDYLVEQANLTQKVKSLNAPEEAVQESIDQTTEEATEESTEETTEEVTEEIKEETTEEIKEETTDEAADTN